MILKKKSNKEREIKTSKKKNKVYACIWYTSSLYWKEKLELEKGVLAKSRYSKVFPAD